MAPAQTPSNSAPTATAAESDEKDPYRIWAGGIGTVPSSCRPPLTAKTQRPYILPEAALPVAGWSKAGGRRILARVSSESEYRASLRGRRCWGRGVPLLQKVGGGGGVDTVKMGG